jgi:prepilin-type N-terminal cleavage/methylation domain-containing protein
MSHKGMTLLEVMLVLAVSAIAIVLAVNYYSNVQINSKITLTIKQVTHIAQGTSQYLQTLQGTKLNVGANSAIAQTLVEGAYISPSDLVNPWARNKNVAIRLLFQPKLLVQIGVPGITTAACKRLQPRLLEIYPNAVVTGCQGKVGTAVVIIPLTPHQEH